MYSVRKLLNQFTGESDPIYYSDNLHEIITVLHACRKESVHETFFITVAPLIEEEQ
jgi:hypothetical protein